MVKQMKQLKQRDFYWGWQVLLFVRGDINEVYLKEILDVGFPIEVYQVNSVGDCSVFAKDPMIWRAAFAASLTHVDRWVSRDCDSVIWAREWHAVQEWILSGLNFHFMRDHENGHHNAVMGGMWGGVGGAWNLFDLYKANKQQGDDQQFYSTHLWPFVKDMQLGHDSQHCVEFFALPFPDPAWHHWVGQTPTYALAPSPDAPRCISLKYNEFET